MTCKQHQQRQSYRASQDMPPGVKGKCCLSKPIAPGAGDLGGHTCLRGSCFWMVISYWFMRGGKRTKRSHSTATHHPHDWQEAVGRDFCWAFSLVGRFAWSKLLCPPMTSNSVTNKPARPQDQAGPIPKSQGESANAPFPWCKNQYPWSNFGFF